MTFDYCIELEGDAGQKVLVEIDEALRGYTHSFSLGHDSDNLYFSSVLKLAESIFDAVGSIRGVKKLQNRFNSTVDLSKTYKFFIE